ncbi:MAG: Hsp70 family protein, partial [Elusimicrobiales bacterium]
DLDGIPPAPRGMPQIEVSFDIDANGILQVHAKDLGTGKAQHITISAPNKLSKEEIDKFMKQAEQFAEADKKYKEKVDAKNEADTVLYATEKALKEHGDKISQDERLAVDRSIGELKEALKGDDLEKMKKAKENLMQVSQKLGEAVYKAAQEKAGKAAPGAGPAPDGAKPAGGKDDVVDAEVVDEQKK